MSPWDAVVAPVSKGGLLGAPFRWGGRGPQDYDCWGLVREVYRRVYDIGLPEWMVPDDDLLEAARLMEAQRRYWQPCDSREPGSVVLLSMKRAWHHIGVVTPWGVLHATKPSVAHPTWAQIERTYQHREGYRWVP